MAIDEVKPGSANALPPISSAGRSTLLTRVFLRSLVVSLILATLMGAYAFLVGSWGSFEVRVLLTTLLISFCSIVALASAAAFPRGRDYRPVYWLSVCGVGVPVVCFFVFMAAIWIDNDFSEPYAKFMAILAIIAVALAQACLLSLAALPRGLRWVYTATLYAIAAVVVVASGMIIIESDASFLFRILGSLGILDGCGTLIIPILAKLHKPAKRKLVPAKKEGTIYLTCPQCGESATHPFGEITCAKCGLTLHITIVEPPRPAA